MPALKPPSQCLEYLIKAHGRFMLQRLCCVPLSPKDTTKLLKISADAKDLEFGRVIHAYLIVSNQASPDCVHHNNSLINFYSKCGQIIIARHLFDRCLKRDVVSWSALMAGYLHNGFALEVLRLFKTLLSVDYLNPNEYVLTTALSSCSDERLLEEGLQCHGYVLKSGLMLHQFVKNALVSMHSMCSEADGGMKILNSLPVSDIFIYNSIINGLLSHCHLNEALYVLKKMMADCVNWDNVTYVNIFVLCARLKDLSLGFQIHSKMLKNNVKYDLFVSTAIIDMYGKCGQISIARKVFDALVIRNVVCWTAILAAYLQNEFFEEAMKLFIEMKLHGVVPNEYSFAVVLNCCAGLSGRGYGNSVHAHTQKSGFKYHINVGNALINMYAKTGDIEAANRLFKDMIQRDSITWNSMICGYSHHGLGKEALIIFHDMLAAGEQPNSITFIGVLSACGHLGQVNEGFFYLHHLMKQMGIEPGLEHYTCIVGLLCKAGLLDEAENFMRSAPVKWDVVAWRTLLSACHVFRNYGLGKRVAEVVLDLDPNDAGTYILLSNMYAKAKRWDGVSTVRKLIRERNVKKEPGVSWTEIRNQTHIFVSDDNRHPESIQIHDKVRELITKIKSLGYVPDIASALRDVEQEQKEDYLSYHSEKLAIAYALIRTPPGAPIHVIKNLRMCEDCHFAVKLISVVTDRVIIVRDVNRFHCFRGGCCSCADYW